MMSTSPEQMQTDEPKVSALRRFVQQHATRLLVGVSAGFLVLSLGVSALVFVTSTGSGDEQAQQATTETNDLITKRQAEIDDRYRSLQKNVGAQDGDRVARDTAAARSLTLAVTGESASTRSVHDSQRYLQARYSFLTPSSQVLTTFIPQWKSTTRSTGASGSQYRLADFPTRVAKISGLNYTAIGLATLSPVTASSPSASPTAPGDAPLTDDTQYVLVQYTTNAEGEVTSFTADRVSNETRDAFVATSRPTSSATAAPATP